jgi:SOS response regulatory protein OraA/RecX
VGFLGLAYNKLSRRLSRHILYVDKRQMDFINNQVPVILSKLTRFSKVKIDLFTNIIAASDSDKIASARNLMKRYLRVLDMEDQFNNALLEYLSMLRKSRSELERYLQGKEIEDARSIVLLLNMLDYVYGYFEAREKFISNQKEVMTRLYTSPAGLGLRPYKPKDDIRRMFTIFHYEQSKLKVLKGGFSSGNLEKIKELIDRLHNLQRTSTAARAIPSIIMAIAPGGIAIGALLWIIYENYIAENLAIYKKFYAAEETLAAEAA